MLSSAMVHPPSQPRQLMMRADGRCYVFPRTNTVALPNNGSDFDEQPVSRTYQYRKVMKPMLERKRRARINRCLDELKELMLTALQSEGENVSKLEKADILELTVRHLHKLKRQRALRISSDKDRFLEGYTVCAAEVSQFLTSSLIQLRNSESSPKVLELAIDQSSGVKLLHHLQSCIQRIETATYRQHDNSPNPYSTPPSSPSPNSATFITIDGGENYVAALGGSVWRPW